MTCNEKALSHHSPKFRNCDFKLLTTLLRRPIRAAPLAKALSILLIPACIALAASPSAASGTSHAEQKPTIQAKQVPELQPPPWPFKAFDKRTRQALLQFFLSHKDYSLKEVGAGFASEKCVDLLAVLKQPAQFAILEHNYVTHHRTDQQTATITKQCPNIPFDRIWYSHTKGPIYPHNDPTYQKLSIDEGDALADFRIEFIGTLEFYDLSRFFQNRTIWGTFAEGGVHRCNDPNSVVCGALEGYRLYGGALGAVFDATTCEILTMKSLNAGRMATRTDMPYAYYENPSFAAFIEIDHEPYRLELINQRNWNDFSKLLEAETTLILKPVTLENNDDKYCLYTSHLHDTTKSNP